MSTSRKTATDNKRRPQAASSRRGPQPVDVLQPIEPAAAVALLSSYDRLSAACDRLWRTYYALRSRLADERPYYDRERASEATAAIERRIAIVGDRHTRLSGECSRISGTLSRTTARGMLVEYLEDRRLKRATADHARQATTGE